MKKLKKKMKSWLKAEVHDCLEQALDERLPEIGEDVANKLRSEHADDKNKKGMPRHNNNVDHHRYQPGHINFDPMAGP